MIDVDDDDVFNDEGVVIFDNADVVDAHVVYDITDDDDFMMTLLMMLLMMMMFMMTLLMMTLTCL